jgi:PAS domain S-box-containing protein
MLSLSPNVSMGAYHNVPVIHPMMIGNEFMTPPINLPEDSQEDFEILCRYAIRQKWIQWTDIKAHLRKATNTIVVTDPGQIIHFVTKGFEAMTGYSAEYARGKKPKFLQGKDTEESVRTMIRTSLEKRIPVEAIITNYRKNGEQYLCQVKILPMFNQNLDLVNFIALENEYVK